MKKYYFSYANIFVGKDLTMYYLTDREIEVLRLVTQGYSNEQIGRILFISKHTAKMHVSTIIRKMGAINRSELAYIAGKENIC
mgnify:CR=1 FL=1